MLYRGLVIVYTQDLLLPDKGATNGGERSGVLRGFVWDVRCAAQALWISPSSTLVGLGSGFPVDSSLVMTTYGYPA
jgi:hypothetical protein